MASQLEISQLRDELQRREAEVAAWERLIHENRDLMRHVAELQQTLAGTALPTVTSAVPGHAPDSSVYWWAVEDMRV